MRPATSSPTPDIQSPDIQSSEIHSPEIQSARLSSRSFWLLALVLVAVPAVVVACAVSVLGAQPYLALNRGVPDELTSMLSALVRVSVDLSSIACIGGLAYSALLRARTGADRHLVFEGDFTVVRVASLIWALSAVALVPIDAADGNGVSLSKLATPGALPYLVSAIYLPAAWIVTAVIAFIIFIASHFVTTWPATMSLLGLGTVGVLSPVVVGQILVGPNHDFGGDAGIIGTTIMTAWLGASVIMLWRLSRNRRVSPTTLKRYGVLSSIALFTGLGAEVILALFKIDGTPPFRNATGYLICADFVIFVGWGVVALFWYRNYRRAAGASKAVYFRLAWGAAVLISLWVAVSVVMTRIPPAQYFVPTSISQLFLGYDISKAPTLVVLFFTGWRINILFAVLSALGISFYLVGVARLRKRGDAWPKGRTAAWVLGWVIVFVTTSSGLGVYSGARFSLHMILHMSLNMFAPVLLVLGGAVTLALRATRPAAPDEPNGHHEWITAMLHWKGARPYTNPIVVFLVFVGSYYVLYFTDLFDQAMRYHWAHQLMNVHFLVIGYLFYGIVIGVDRPPHPLPSLAKLGLVFAAMPFHAFFGVIVMTSDSVIANTYYQYLDPPWMGSLKSDQYLGGGIAWAAGELPLIIVILALVVQWSRQDRRESVRKDRHLDSGMDDSYDAYNEMLARLAARKPVRQGTGASE